MANEKKKGNFLTLEEAQGIFEESMGETLKTLDERLKDNRASVLKDVGYLIKHGGDVKGGSKSEWRKLPREQRMAEFGKMLGCIAAAGGRDVDKAASIAKGDGLAFISKALGSSTVAGGGVLVEPEFSPDFIELLREDSVLIQMGIRRVGMASQVLNFGGVGTGATAAYRGESAAATYSQPTTRGLELKAKLLAVQCAASEQFLRGDGNVAFVQEELTGATQNKMDEQGIIGDGTVNAPKGLKNLALAGNKFNETNVAGTSGGSTTAEIVKDLGTCMANIKAGDLMMVRPGWLFPTRVWLRLFTELDANSNPIFRDQLDRGTLFGIPYKETNHIPITDTAAAGSGGGSDASAVYLADFWHVLLGETKLLSIKASTEAAYTDSGGLKSAWERGETAFMVEMEHDFAARHASKISVIQSNTWGTV
jgi:HK97 family phage major capsid protein